MCCWYQQAVVFLGHSNTKSLFRSLNSTVPHKINNTWSALFLPGVLLRFLQSSSSSSMPLYFKCQHTILLNWLLYIFLWLAALPRNDCCWNDFLMPLITIAVFDCGQFWMRYNKKILHCRPLTHLEHSADDSFPFSRFIITLPGFGLKQDCWMTLI